IYLMVKDKAYKSLVFTSYHKGEGVSTVSRNVGLCIASVLGHSVLVIDANPRHKNQAAKAGKPKPMGLFDILEEKAELLPCIQTTYERLHFLPAGQASLNPGVLFGSHRMNDILKQAKDKYDVVIFDTDSMDVSKDALELCNGVGAVVFV